MHPPLREGRMILVARAHSIVLQRGQPRVQLPRGRRRSLWVNSPLTDQRTCVSSTHPIPNQESTGASISIKIKLELQHSLRATASSRSFRGCLEMPMLTSGHQCGPGFLAELGTCLQLLISHLLSSRRYLGRAGTIIQLGKLKEN